MEQEHMTPEAAPETSDPEQALLAREQAVAAAERRLKARAELHRLGLPEEAADALDCASEEGLTRGMRLVQLLNRHYQAAPAPKAHVPLPVGRALNYRALADIYRTDPANYHQHMHMQPKNGGER